MKYKLIGIGITLLFSKFLGAKTIYEDKKYLKEEFFIHNDFEMKVKLKPEDYKILHNFTKLAKIFNKKNVMFKLELINNKKDRLKHFKKATFSTLKKDTKYELFYVYKYKAFLLNNNNNSKHNINDIYVNKIDLLNPSNNFYISKPLKYVYISSSYSKSRYHPILHKYRAHHGIDFVNYKNTKIFAAASGKIVKIGRNGSYGKYIKIKHKNGYFTEYAHLNKYAKLKKGSFVKKGQLIGYLGNTGRSTGPHLHFGLLKGKKFVNPLYYFKDNKDINQLVLFSKKNKKLTRNHKLKRLINIKNKIFNKM
jgi:murein DD-endopeptidase MepM/ murein hydrolase activator NlpD